MTAAINAVKTVKKSKMGGVLRLVGHWTWCGGFWVILLPPSPNLGYVCIVISTPIPETHSLSFFVKLSVIIKLKMKQPRQNSLASYMAMTLKSTNFTDGIVSKKDDQSNTF